MKKVPPNKQNEKHDSSADFQVRFEKSTRFLRVKVQ